jgi:hypothetical protein
VHQKFRKYRSLRNPALQVVIAGILELVAGFACAQSTPSTHSWNMFSSIESQISDSDYNQQDFSIGESSLFGTGSINDRFSYLTETTFLPSRYRDQEVVVERFSLQYELTPDTFFSFGKIHNPVNYWNDTYHHGRLFFPTINRPLSMGTHIPLHEIAARLGARNLGSHTASFDVVVGSGQESVESNDPFSNGVRSLTLMAGFKPVPEIMVQASIFFEKNLDHTGLSSHQAAHGGSPMVMESLMPDADEGTGTEGLMDGMKSHAQNNYSIGSLSIRFEKGIFESLTELSGSKFQSHDMNFAFYSYAGFRVHDKLTAYGFVDTTHVSEAFHFTKGNEYRYGLGMNYFPGASWSLKTELSNWSMKSQNDILLHFQLSAGF